MYTCLLTPGCKGCRDQQCLYSSLDCGSHILQLAATFSLLANSALCNWSPAVTMLTGGAMGHTAYYWQFPLPCSDDGNLVLYHNLEDIGVPLWASDATVPKQRVGRADFQVEALILISPILTISATISAAI
jgi:hypothetical protein